MRANANVILSERVWDNLHTFLKDERLPESCMAELTRLGFLERGLLTDVGQSLLAAYIEPVGYVQLILNDAGVLRHAAAWIDQDKKSSVAQIVDGDIAISSYRPAEFPVVMIDLLDIGPRPIAHPPAEVTVPKEWVLELLESTDAGLDGRLAREIGASWPEACNAMYDGDWKLWFVYSRSAKEAQQIRASVCVLDTSSGYFSIVSNGDAAIIRPATTLQVWCALAEVIAPAT